jgi:hypothetical protein
MKEQRDVTFASWIDSQIGWFHVTSQHETR